MRLSNSAESRSRPRGSLGAVAPPEDGTRPLPSQESSAGSVISRMLRIGDGLAAWIEVVTKTRRAKAEDGMVR